MISVVLVFLDVLVGQEVGGVVGIRQGGRAPGAAHGWAGTVRAQVRACRAGTRALVDLLEQWFEIISLNSYN